MYRIIDGGNIYKIDTVTDGSTNFSGRSTDRPVYSGESISDHYVLNPIGITVNGVISDIKSLYNPANLNTLSWIERLSELQQSGRTFIVEVIKDSAMTFDNCVFDSLEISNDKTHGRATFDNGTSIYSFLVSMKLKQIKKASRGKIVSEPDLQSATSPLTKASGVNSSPETEQKKQTYADMQREALREAGILNRRANE